MIVQRTALSRLTPLAEGGFGQVHRVDGFTLPGNPAPLAYKEFTREHAAQGRSASAAVAFRDGLSDADRAGLDWYSAWPCAIVTDDKGTVCGVLMPLIPGAFFCQLDNGGGTLVSKPREMGWLIAPAKQRRDVGIDLPVVDDTDRLILLTQLAYAIGRLHRHGWVFGDLSFKNAVFALDPPRIMLLDCDGAAALDDAERFQSSSPHWYPPECGPSQASGPGYRQDLQDTVTDVYKLGLAIVRCLTPADSPVPPGVPSAAQSRDAQRIKHALDAAGVGLVTRALSSDRAARPTAKELHAYLYAVASTRLAPPLITMARLAMPVVQRGQEAWVDWQIAAPGQVTVTVGKDTAAQVDGRVHTRGCYFRPLAPGPVRVEVTNPYGRAAADAGYVALFELPDFSIPVIDLPAPSIPALPAISHHAFSAAFASAPDSLSSIPGIPPLPTTDMSAVLTSLLPGGMPEIQFPALPALEAPRLFDGLPSDTTPVIPWPDLHGLYGEFIEAASALSARVLREALHNVTRGTGNRQ